MRIEMQTSKFGGEIISLKLNGEERIHQGEDCKNERGEAYWKRHSPVLFPIVGKLKDNKTSMKGQTYEMGQHGFARDMEFEEIHKDDKMHSYQLRSNEETLKKYPFVFCLKVTYEVKENQLTTRYQVINEGNEDMPFGIGGHPGFCINKEELIEGNYFLELEKEEKDIIFKKLKDGLICKEEGENLLKDDRKIQLDVQTFEKDAIILTNIQSHQIALWNRKEGKKELKVSFEGFPYLGIWSKPGAPFLCIEPWQSMADEENSSGKYEKKLRNKSNKTSRRIYM